MWALVKRAAGVLPAKGPHHLSCPKPRQLTCLPARPPNLCQQIIEGGEYFVLKKIEGGASH